MINNHTMKRNFLTLVLGMHRSGTSLLTNGLLSLGFDLGNNLMPPGVDNPKGFWEDLDIVQINDTIINRFSHWSHITPHFEFLQLLVTQEERLKAIEIINEKLKIVSPHAIKDPRLSILLPFWQDIFNICNCSTYNILTIRNPVEVALSLNKRNKIPLEYGLQLWLYYNLSCLRDLHDHFLVVPFQGLLECPQEEFGRIAQYTQAPISHSHINNLNNIVEKGLRHNKSDILVTKDLCKFADQINEIYSRLLVESKNLSTQADIFRKSIDEQMLLLESDDFYRNFSAKFNPANQFKLRVNSLLLTENNVRQVMAADLTSKGYKNLQFTIPDDYRGTAQLELPEESCVIEILKADVTSVTQQTRSIAVNSGNYSLSYKNTFLFDTSSPFLNFNIGQGTVLASFIYRILKDEHQATLQSKQNNVMPNTALLLIRTRDYPFLPKHSLSASIYGGTTEITFNLKDYANKEIEELRFNPCNGIATISLHCITIEYFNHTSYKLPSESIRTNAIETDDSKLIFLSSHSCVFIDLPKTKLVGIHRVRIKLNYFNFLPHQLEATFNEVRDLYNRQKEQLLQKEDTISSQLETITSLKIRSESTDLITLRYERQKNLKKAKSIIFLRIIKALSRLLCSPKTETQYYKNRKKILAKGLFKEQYYLNNNIDLIPSCIDTFRHFYFEGWKEGRNPHPEFNTTFYLSSYPDVKKNNINPLVHYVNSGEVEGRFTSKLQREVKIIKQSGLFDTDWYLDQYPLTKSLEPIHHYCLYGHAEGKFPSPLFDTAFYKKEYDKELKEDKKATKLIETNPLVHYILEGKSKNQRTHNFTRDSILKLLPNLRHKDIYSIIKQSKLLLDEFYLSQLDSSCDDTINHYISIGYSNGIKPNPFFDNDYYLSQFPELNSYNIPPLLHYTLFGSKNGHKPCDFFDPNFYNRYYTNVTELGIDPLAHFISWGWKEWRRPKLDFHTPYYTYSNRKKYNDVFEFSDRLLSYESPSLKATDYPNYQTWYSKDTPKVSIVLLNWNKSFLTLDCLISLWQFTTGFTYEIIVVDNGSRYSERKQLSSVSSYIKLIYLDINRFYGEGNNIGVEEAKGEYVVLLNNDTIATENWLSPLIQALESNKDVGVTGAKLLFPDGTIQEMGALVDTDGNVTQIGKHEPDNTEQNMSEVDYVSGACLAISKDDFNQILGFDYIWEPAYYEDNDLCWKVKLLGKRIFVVPESAIYHLEHVSISNQQELNFASIIEQNKNKFLARWKEYIYDRKNKPSLVFSDLSNIPPLHKTKPNAMLYTPYPILLGGGERYLLTIAEYLQLHYNVFLVLPERYSRLRILTIGRDLGLDLTQLQIRKFSDLGIDDITFDLSIVMGNEILPRIPAIAKRNIFHCQFPFKYYYRENGFQHFHVPYYNSYDCIVVNSEFTKFNIQKQQRDYSLMEHPVHIAYPPVGEFSTGNISELIAIKKHQKILTIGRFFVGGHNKKHDFLIKTFKLLVDKLGYKNAQLHLVGGTHTENVHRSYVDYLQELAVGYNIHFHFDMASEGVAELLQTSSIYWHATGIDVDPIDYPEAMEHFGITPVEAMKACCIPILPNKGGVCEIVKGCSSQILTYRNENELLHITDKLFNLSSNELYAIRQDILERTSRYGKKQFIEQLTQIIDLKVLD